ncbi:MAG: hypothetical protein Tsb0034_14540 [Ekhidna sp.]
MVYPLQKLFSFMRNKTYLESHEKNNVSDRFDGSRERNSARQNSHKICQNDYG